MLDSGFVIYSQSFLSDFILIFKERHIIVSIWTCHEDSGFKRQDRFYVLVLSLMFAFAFSGIIGLMDKAEAATGLTITITIVSTIMQTMYDSIAKLVTKCGCFTGCPSCILNCCLYLGKCALALQCVVASTFLLVMIIMLAAADHFGVALYAFASSKGTAFFVSSVAALLVTTYMKRLKQMKPDPEKMKNADVKKGWYDKVPRNCFLCCISCGFLGQPKKPRCTAWNKWYGDHTEMTDLPAKAPDYDYHVKCGCNAQACCGCKRCTVYEHKGTYDKEKDVWTKDTPPGVGLTNKTETEADAEAGEAAGDAPAAESMERADAEPPAAAPATEPEAAPAAAESTPAAEPEAPAATTTEVTPVTGATL